MRTVGILTLSNSDNYGAVLQAYALRKFLCSNDYNVFFVPHAPTEKSKKRYLTAPIATIEKAYGLGFGAVWNGYSRKKNGSKTEAFRDIFSSFRAEFLGLTSTRLSYDDLVRDPPLADAFVVGSDVVWGYDAYFNDAAYLLGFCGSCARRVSYAASFGKTRIERYQEPIFAAKLSQFDAISVREQSAAIILEKLGITKAHVVCDPTFLIDDFEELDDDAETQTINTSVLTCFHRRRPCSRLQSRLHRQCPGVWACRLGGLRLITFRLFPTLGPSYIQRPESF